MRKPKQLVIDMDLLGLASFLIRGGSGSSCYTNSYVWFLTEVVEQIHPKHVAGHIIQLAFDNIPSSALEAYVKFALGKASLSKETERFLRDRGFIYGEEPTVPRQVLVRCKWYMKHVYGD